MNISITIMAHPKRKREAMALHKKLIQQPFSKVRIVWDEINNEWHTGERSMRSGAAADGWHVVIQDDAILTPDFYFNIERVIEAVPTKTVISLYTGKVRPLADRVTAAMKNAPDGCFLQHYMMMWGVGILIPADHIEPMLEYINDPIYSDTPYDTRIGIFYQRNRLPIYYTVPSLVDHDDDIGSLIGNGYALEPRVAHRRSRGLVSWTDTVIPI